jgi:hypothetical protein
MKSHEIQFQSLTVLVIQLLTTQQSSISTPVRECIKRGVVVQSEPLSPCINDASLSIMKKVDIVHDRQRLTIVNIKHHFLLELMA